MKCTNDQIIRRLLELREKMNGLCNIGDIDDELLKITSDLIIKLKVDIKNIRN